MKKNRFLALALSLLMALALPLGAFAEENEPDTLLEGLVTEEMCIRDRHARAPQGRLPHGPVFERIVRKRARHAADA